MTIALILILTHISAFVVGVLLSKKIFNKINNFTENETTT